MNVRDEDAIELDAMVHGGHVTQREDEQPLLAQLLMHDRRRLGAQQAAGRLPSDRLSYIGVLHAT